MKLITDIRKELEFEKNLLEKCQRQLKLLPEGRLSCSTINGKRYYSFRNSTGKHYIGDASKELVSQLMERKIIEKMVVALKNNISKITSLRVRTEDYDIGIIADKCGISPDIIPDSVYKHLDMLDTRNWDSLNHQDSGFYDDRRIHSTVNGIKVRSRIEAAISDLYYYKEIEALYEKPLQLSNGRIIHPDFTVYVESEHRIKYHEHCGMMNVPEYRDNFLVKLRDYLDDGLFPFKDVLFTFDSGDNEVDLAEIGALIDMYML